MSIRERKRMALRERGKYTRGDEDEGSLPRGSVNRRLEKQLLLAGKIDRSADALLAYMYAESKYIAAEGLHIP